jgi:hypothetical protein
MLRMQFLSSVLQHTVMLFYYVMRIYVSCWGGVLKCLQWCGAHSSRVTEICIKYEDKLCIIVVVIGSVVVKALCYKPEGRGFDN